MLPTHFLFLRPSTLKRFFFPSKLQTFKQISRALNATVAKEGYTYPSKYEFKVDKKGLKKYSFINYEDGKYYRPCLCFDLETTGLDFKKDKILELSLVITDRNLDFISSGAYNAVAKIVPEDLELLDEWTEKTHTESGLLHECLSIRAKTIEQIDDELFNYARQFLSEKEKGVLLGNSVHFDRYFVQEHLPKFDSLLSHKVIDVTSFLEMRLRANPEMPVFFKPSKHRSKTDVVDSLRVARNFKYNVFDKAGE